MTSEFTSFYHYLHLLFTIRQEFFLTSEGMRDLFVSLISFRTYLYDNGNRQETFRFAKKIGPGGTGCQSESAHRAER
jgi:hypothetical protein